MHSPSVSQELVKIVRANGGISRQEFARLILHWFPSAWTLLMSLKRQASPQYRSEKHDDEDTVSFRFLNALRDKFAKPQIQLVEPHVVRISIADMIGTQAIHQVYEIMASDAIHECAEVTFGVRLYLEDEETLVMVPDGLRSLPLRLSPLSLIEDRYHLACTQMRAVLADMDQSKCGFGRLDCTQIPGNRLELIRFMAIRAHRLRLEREYGVEFACQWPGVIACARRDAAEQLEVFRSPIEQILSIHRIVV